MAITQTTNPYQSPKIHSEPSTAYKWWVVFMLWFVCFFNYADRQAISAVLPTLQEEFHFDKVQLGWISSAFMWVYAAGAPLAGFIGDRLRRKDLILGGCLFWSFITVTTSWCAQLWQFITVRALEGLGETFYFPASVSLTSDYHGRATRSRALAFHQSSVYLGTIAGSWFAAWLAQHYGWRYGFYFFGGAGIVLALVLYRFLLEPQRGQSEASAVADIAAETPLPLGETLRAIFRRPTAVVLMVVFVGANFVATGFLTWMPTFLYEKFHFSLAEAGLTGTLYINLASAVSVPLAGWLADRLVRRLPVGRIAVQALGLLVGACFVMMIGRATDTTVLIVAMAAFGFAKGFYDSGIFASLYDVIEPRARATAAGLMNTIGWAGGACGPLVIGWTAKHGRFGTEIDNMSEAIARGSYVYLAGTALLIVAMATVARRDLAPAARA